MFKIGDIIKSAYGGCSFYKVIGINEDGTLTIEGCRHKDIHTHITAFHWKIYQPPLRNKKHPLTKIFQNV